MGLELRVTAGDVRSLFTKDREPLMAALRHKDPSTGIKYSPNLYTSPLNKVMNLMIRGVPEYLKATLVGFDKDLLEQRVMVAADTWRDLVASLNEERPIDLDGVIFQHISQLRLFEGFYKQLSGISTAELPEKQAKSFERGVAGLRTVIVRSNMLYNPRSRRGFLQHVSEGMLEQEYEQKLLRQDGLFAQLRETAGLAIAKMRTYFRHNDR